MDIRHFGYLVLNIILYRSGYLLEHIVGLVFGFVFRKSEKNLGFGGSENTLGCVINLVICLS